MIKFNTILESESIDPAHVKLVRHQAVSLSRTPYQLWLHNKDAFELFQKIQARSVFSDAAMLASCRRMRVDSVITNNPARSRAALLL